MNLVGNVDQQLIPCSNAKVLPNVTLVVLDDCVQIQGPCLVM